MSEINKHNPALEGAPMPSALDIADLGASLIELDQSTEAIKESFKAAELIEPDAGSRDSRRSFPNSIEAAVHRFHEQAVLCALDDESDQDLLDVITDMIMSREAVIGTNSLQVAHHVYKAAAFTQLNRDAITVIIPQVQSVFGSDNIDNQYTIMRVLAQNEKNYRGEEHDSAAACLQETVAFYDAHNKQEPISGDIIERLEEGDYDHLIGRDMLINLEATQTNDDLSKLKQLLILQGMPVDTAIQFLSQPDAVALWPSGAQKQLNIQRQVYKNAILENRQLHLADMKEYGVAIGEEGSIDAFERSLDALQAAQRRANSIMNEVSRRSLKAVAAPTTRKRTNRNRNRAPLQSEDAVSDHETLDEPRSVVYIDSQHNEQQLGSQAFIDMRQKYLDSHRGDTRLAQDVDNVIKWLASVDLSRGSVFGIKKYHQSVKIGDNNYNLYGLKPKDAVGLTTGSPFAKKMRLLFALTDNTAKILAISDRDEMIKTERSLGINSSAST